MFKKQLGINHEMYFRILQHFFAAEPLVPVGIEHPFVLLKKIEDPGGVYDSSNRFGCPPRGRQEHVIIRDCNVPAAVDRSKQELDISFPGNVVD